MRDLVLAYVGPEHGIKTRQLKTLDTLMRILSPISLQLIYRREYSHGNLTVAAIASRRGMAVNMVDDIRIADALIACSGGELEVDAAACYKICSEMRKLHRPVYTIHSDGKVEVNA